jgi:hypothetical protein
MLYTPSGSKRNTDGWVAGWLGGWVGGWMDRWSTITEKNRKLYHLIILK